MYVSWIQSYCISILHDWFAAHSCISWEPFHTLIHKTASLSFACCTPHTHNTYFSFHSVLKLPKNISLFSQSKIMFDLTFWLNFDDIFNFDQFLPTLFSTSLVTLFDHKLHFFQKKKIFKNCTEMRLLGYFQAQCFLWVQCDVMKLLKHQRKSTFSGGAGGKVGNLVVKSASLISIYYSSLL